MKELAEKLPV